MSCFTYHGLHTVIVEYVVLDNEMHRDQPLSYVIEEPTDRITVVDNSTDTSIDDLLEQRPRVPHPVASVCKVEVNLIVAHDPIRFCSDLSHESRIGEVRCEIRRVDIRIKGRNIVRVP